MNCVKAGNFIEAELAKQRVIQLQKIQDKKLFKEALKKQNIEKKYQTLSAQKEREGLEEKREKFWKIKKNI